MVERNWVQAILSVVPVRIGPLSNPETAYANPDCGPFLLSIRTMETKFWRLVARMEARQKELYILRPLQDTSGGIPNIFPATFFFSEHGFDKYRESPRNSGGNWTIVTSSPMFAYPGMGWRPTSIHPAGSMVSTGMRRRVFLVCWFICVPPLARAISERRYWLSCHIYSVPKRPVRHLGTTTTAAPGVPGLSLKF